MFGVTSVVSMALGFTLARLIAGHPTTGDRTPRNVASTGVPSSGLAVGPPISRAAPSVRGPQATPSRDVALTLPDASISQIYRPAALTSPSEAGTAAAKEILAFLNGDSGGCARALALYREIEPIEPLGGEYPTLRWFCTYATATPAAQEIARKSPEVARFIDHLGVRDWGPLRDYLRQKYLLSTSGAASGHPVDFFWLDELVRFNSPGRAEWEHTDEVMALLAAKPGMAVADVGAGAGFYSFRLSAAVGENGRVYAVEVSALDLDYIKSVKAAENLTNLDVVEGTRTSVGIGAQTVDIIFLCTTYQSIYLEVREEDRRAWIQSMIDALRPGGRVIIAENTPDGELDGAHPYLGVGLSAGLVKAQLQAYGFRLVREEHFIPQRYVLVFDRGDAAE